MVIFYFLVNIIHVFFIHLFLSPLLPFSPMVFYHSALFPALKPSIHILQSFPTFGNIVIWVAYFFVRVGLSCAL